MKKATGFITADGTFFESEKEAALYEAEFRLRAKLSLQFPELSQNKFFAIMQSTITEIGEYINAHEAAGAVERNKAEDENRDEDKPSPPAEANDGLGHVSSTEEDLARLLQLPTRGLEHVPDVGRRTRSKKVSDRRKVDGS